MTGPQFSACLLIEQNESVKRITAGAMLWPALSSRPPVVTLHVPHALWQRCQENKNWRHTRAQLQQPGLSGWCTLGRAATQKCRVMMSLRLRVAAETGDCRPWAACNTIRHGRQRCGFAAGLGPALPAGCAALQSQLALIFVLVPPPAAGGSGRLQQCWASAAVCC